MVLGSFDQRADIFGEAGAAEARTGMEELAADPIVEPDPARNLLHVGAGALGEISDLVDEGNLGGEERVGGVFDQFGGTPAGIHDRRLVEIEWTVDLCDHIAGALVLGTDYNAIRMFEVPDRSAFT